MSSRNDGGIGCFGLIAGLVLVSIVITFWWQILLTLLGLAVVAGLVAWGSASSQETARRLAERSACAVCQGWSGSVVLTDIDAAAASALCRDHGPVHRRIAALELQTAPDPHWEGG